MRFFEGAIRYIVVVPLFFSGYNFQENFEN